MQMTIADLLPDADLDRIAGDLSRLRFDDGRATAGRAAALVKRNGQARESATVALLRDLVSQALLAHPVVQAAIRPKALSRLLFSRYRGGETYGRHVDNPLMEGLRTDVSFTLFLSDPATYEGGELVLEGPGGEESVKLPRGQLFVYPSTTLHRVEPVTSGERLACVGWAQSWIRETGRREILFDLDTAKSEILAVSGKTPAYDLVAKASANLLRLWAE